MAARLGVKGGVRKSFGDGGGGVVGDARQKIIQANRVKTGDARDKLGKIAKGMDARQKLEKIRNLKEGKLEVKKVGGITVTKKVGGKISLSTKSGAAAAGPTETKKSPSFKEVKQIGRLTKTVSSSGQVTLSSKSGSGGGVTSSGGMRSGGVPAGVAGRSQEKGQVQGRSRSEGGRQGGAGSVLRGTGGAARGEQKENVRRSVGGLSRDIDRLDDELLNARVDPFLLKRTIENSRTRSVGGSSRSPVRGQQPRR